MSLKDRIEDIQKISDEFEAVTGPMELTPESPILDSFYSVMEMSIELLSEAVGDKDGWIEYFVYDCEFGKNPLEVTIGEEKISLDSVDKLIYILGKQVKDDWFYKL